MKRPYQQGMIQFNKERRICLGRNWNMARASSIFWHKEHNLLRLILLLFSIIRLIRKRIHKNPAEENEDEPANHKKPY
ncbi:hypothetical protein BK147_19595 [Paenibacillus sp. FSL R7-0337]|nr:hypothetical protein BK147_19595 [Paenibacillus sp. FSL R7-0337]